MTLDHRLSQPVLVLASTIADKQTMAPIREYLEVCERAVRAAGAVLLEKIGQVEVREKGRSDLVTEADFASQETVRRIVLDAFPDHSVLGEEQEAGWALPGGPAADHRGEYRWIVDPLDGTTNYVHQARPFSVSLALERSGRLLAGGVYDPVADECFTAAAGQGARLNGRPIRTSSVTRLSQALATVSFPTVTLPDSPDLKLFLAALNTCQSVRRTGSAALNLAYLAAGRFDVSWAFSTKPWDVAAGALLILEAGGTVSGPHGGPFVLDTGQYLAAANLPLYAELLAMTTETVVS